MSDFRNSKTKDNLMRAFAGESQARNRYTMAEEKARQQKLYVQRELEAALDIDALCDRAMAGREFVRIKF